MRKLLCITAAASACIALAFTSHASAVAITGNPAADSGWAHQGTSLYNGTYVRGAGNFNFDVYSALITLDASSPLVTGSAGDGAWAWLPGDTVLGMGGDFTAYDDGEAGWGVSISGDPINSNLTTSARMVSKFGVSPSSWSASTVAPPSGNGQGSTSAGHGGDGAILLGTNVGVFSAANEGSFILPDHSHRYTPSQITLDARIGRYIYQLDGDLLASWQTLLNVSLLEREHAYLNIPAAGDRGVQTIQRSTNATLFTDGLVMVPEPATLSLLGLGGLALLRRRR